VKHRPPPIPNNNNATSPIHQQNHSNMRRQSGISDIDDTDNASMVSELTSGTQQRRDSFNGDNQKANAAKRRMTRKSIFDTSQFAMTAGNIAGRNLLTADMLEYIREECVDTIIAEDIRTASIQNPQILLGWQIAITNEANGEMEIFVITDVRKNLLSKTEYRLSRFYQDDLWMKLKRSETKLGVDFRPLRKVLYGLQDDDDSITGSVAL